MARQQQGAIDMTHTFRAVAEAAKLIDANKWEIGDALIVETGTRDNPKCYGDRPGYLTFEQWLALPDDVAARSPLPDTPIPMSDVVKELRAHGLETNVRRLHQLRDIAEAFPPSQRRAGISWDVQAEAGSPKNLDMVLAAMDRGPLAGG
jgi:hypothetical protein